MGWIASLKGSTDHLDKEVADEIEVAVRDALAEVFGGLVPAGHQGVAGTFHYSTGGPSDLRDATPHPGPEPPASSVQQNPVSNVPADVATLSVPPGTAAGE